MAAEKHKGGSSNGKGEKLGKTEQGQVQEGEPHISTECPWNSTPVNS